MKKAIEHLRAHDPVMAGLVERVGPYRMTYKEPNFESLVRSIVFQQLSGKAAGTIYGRVQAAVGEVTPERLLARTAEELRGWGLSGQKASYVRDLAEKTQAGLIRFQDLPALDDAAVIEHLTQVKGVGVWTVQMFLMFALRRPDVLPVGDLGIRMAMKQAYRMRELPKPERMERVARPWRPYATVACWYLWRSLDGEAAL
jgi:DNA-3-methyladenine glycosylase II